MCLFVLIDCRLEPQQIDQEFMEWASNNNIPFVILFTKSDKISKPILKKKLRIYKDYMLKRWEKLPELFITSAKIGTSSKQLKQYPYSGSSFIIKTDYQGLKIPYTSIKF